MKLFGHELTGRPRILAVLTAILLVDFGLCGIQTAIGIDPMSGGFWILPGLLEWLTFWVVLTLLVCYLFVWGCESIGTRLQRPKKDRVQRLFGPDRESNK